MQYTLFLMLFGIWNQPMSDCTLFIPNRLGYQQAKIIFLTRHPVKKLSYCQELTGRQKPRHSADKSTKNNDTSYANLWTYALIVEHSHGDEHIVSFFGFTLMPRQFRTFLDFLPPRQLLIITPHGHIATLRRSVAPGQDG